MERRPALPPIEPAVFARLMMLPPPLRADLLECVGATGMPSRQVEDLMERMMRDHRERRVKDSAGADLQ